MTTDLCEYILSGLRADSDILSLVPSSSILRSFPREAIELPAIILHVVDSSSTPPFGYSGDTQKFRLEYVYLQFDILSDKSRYEADRIRDLVEKKLYSLPNLSASKVSAPEDYDESANVYISRVRFRVIWKVNDV